MRIARGPANLLLKFIVPPCLPICSNRELFGHVKGSFTGAHRDKMGRFELANGGTLFLDEIGDINLDVQTKLLRVLQEKVLERVGSSEPVQVDVRIITATHQNLEKLIRLGKFREDLYYRLNVFPIEVPPLRERVEDIAELAMFLCGSRPSAAKNSWTTSMMTLWSCSKRTPGRGTFANWRMSLNGPW